MGELAMMGIGGDDKLTWNPANDIETSNAKKKFYEMIGRKGVKAYKTLDVAGQKKGEEIFEFDPYLERILFVGQMVGG